MKLKSKKNVITLTVGLFALLSFLLWLSLRQVEIVAVHKDGSYSDVLVRNFPLKNKGKINWWRENKDMLREKYKIPSDFSGKSFVIIFWDIGEGYKETDGYDRLCFKDMKPPKNCIDKNSLLIVRNSKNSGLYFVLDDGSYRINSKGKFIKLDPDY